MIDLTVGERPRESRSSCYVSVGGPKDNVYVDARLRIGGYHCIVVGQKIEQVP